MPKAMVIGGPGNISTSAMLDLLDRGYQVVLFSKPGSAFDEADPRVKIYQGDRDVPGELEAAFGDFRPDVFLDLACFLPEQAERAVTLTFGKVAHVIFASTVDVYGYPLARLPFREQDPWQKHTRSIYAANKRRCEAIFRAKADPQRYPVTLVRPSYSFGRRFILSALNRSAGPALLYRLHNRLPILVPGDGTTLIHASSGYNTGRMIAAMVGDERTFGQAYTCAHPTTMEYEQYIRLFAGAVGVEPVLVYVPTDVILSVKTDEMRDNLLDELTRYNLFFSIDRFLRDFPDFQFEPLEAAARRAVAWNIEQGRVAPVPMIDDRIIEAYQRCMAGFTAH